MHDVSSEAEVGGATARIQPVGTEQIEQLLPLFEAYRGFYQAPPDETGSRAFLRDRISSGDAIAVIAMAGHDAAGFALIYPSFSSVRRGRLFILNDLFVRHDFRQRGIGRLLLDAAVEVARAGGALALQLETQQTNTVAQALYLEQGWEPDEEFCTYHYPL